MAKARFAACAGSAVALLLASSGTTFAQTASNDTLGSASANSAVNAFPAAPGSTNEADTSKKNSAKASTQILPGEEDAALADDGLNLRARPESRLNAAQTTVDPVTTATNPDEDGASGIRVGGFIFNPSLRQSLGYERTRTGGAESDRTFSETELKGSLTSDWSRHQLTVEGTGTFEKDISGKGADDPSWNLNAALRLDVTRDTTVTINGSYNFAHEDATDPNSVTDAKTQSGVHTLTGGISTEQNFGRLKGTLSLDANRSIYGPARLSDGTTLSQSDRNAFGGTLALRLGYQISPAISPFVEGSISRTYYDQSKDANGYARDSAGWGLRAGIESDLGEKLRGEISAGYEKVSYKDSRLASIAAITVDGSLTWSPRRGTNVTVGLSTNVNPSTSAGTSGYVSKAFTAELSQEITRRLVARLSGGVTDNRYSASNSDADRRSWTAGAGLTWSANRYVDVTGDIDWQLDQSATGSDTQTTTFMAGVTLKR